MYYYYYYCYYHRTTQEGRMAPMVSEITNRTHSTAPSSSGSVCPTMSYVCVCVCVRTGPNR